LVLGLGGRLCLFVFFLYNITCVISFHFLLTPQGSAGLADHISWGLLLLLLMVHGMGKLSLDHWFHKKWGNHLTSVS
jgi:putative oxidoreductase